MVDVDGESNRRLIPETLVGWRKRHRALFSSDSLVVPSIAGFIFLWKRARHFFQGPATEATTDGGKKRGLAGCLARMGGFDHRGFGCLVVLACLAGIKRVREWGRL